MSCSWLLLASSSLTAFLCPRAGVDGQRSSTARRNACKSICWRMRSLCRCFSDLKLWKSYWKANLHLQRHGESWIAFPLALSESAAPVCALQLQLMMDPGYIFPLVIETVLCLRSSLDTKIPSVIALLLSCRLSSPIVMCSSIDKTWVALIRSANKNQPGSYQSVKSLKRHSHDSLH